VEGSGRSKEDTVDEVKRWIVTVDLDEHDGRTRARARLHTRDTDRLVGVGTAHLNPTDLDVPEIGDEIAVARALSDLGARLLRTAADDVAAVTGEHAFLPH
jgi:Domain of unknown function (DUF1876)